MAPLREIGIPAAGIMDVDVIADVTGWKAIWPTLHLTAADQSSLEDARKRCEEILRKAPLDRRRQPSYKKRGLAVLPSRDRKTLQSFLDQLAAHGLFVVPVGELESWLKTAAIQAPKPEWVVRVFEWLGDEPDSPGYVKPGRGDVWAFMDKVGAWTSDPDRQGMP